MLKTKLLGATAAAELLAIEDVFSIYFHNGTSATQTVTNGIDLAGEGGLVWIKYRSTSADHFLFDTQRGATKYVRSNSTAAEVTNANSLTSFNADGFSLGSSVGNLNATTIASWTFRKAKRFFDVVTYTGDGVIGRQISHNLGSSPGAIFIKRTNTTNNWAVWHRSATQDNQYAAVLNQTFAYGDRGERMWGQLGGTPDMNSSTFSLGNSDYVNSYYGSIKGKLLKRLSDSFLAAMIILTGIIGFSSSSGFL